VFTVLSASLWMASQSSSAACLRKPIQIDASRTAYSLVLVPEREVPQYESEGFARVDCPADRNVIRGYVKQICEGALQMARRAPDVDAAFSNIRARACASARAALEELGG
jgi:hypothetical protein